MCKTRVDDTRVLAHAKKGHKCCNNTHVQTRQIQQIPAASMMVQPKSRARPSWDLLSVPGGLRSTPMAT